MNGWQIARYLNQKIVGTIKYQIPHIADINDFCRNHNQLIGIKLPLNCYCHCAAHDPGYRQFDKRVNDSRPDH